VTERYWRATASMPIFLSLFQERLTRKSGLELNADKTEILRIGHLNEHEVLLSINYMGKVYKIRNVDQIKICGLYYCNDPVVE
jgi:hypothetical protein